MGEEDPPEIVHNVNPLHKMSIWAILLAHFLIPS